MAVAAASVADIVVVIVRDNPLVERVAVVAAGSCTGTTSELLSGTMAELEVGLGLGLCLCFKFFDSESSLDYLLFLGVIFLLLLFLFVTPPPPVIIAAVSAVGFKM